MPFVPKLTVRGQLTVTVLLAIMLSWIVSATTSALILRYEINALRQQMIAQPNLYPVPIPEPRLRWTDFIIGPTEVFPRQLAPRAQRPAPQQEDFRRPPPNEGPPPVGQLHPPPRNGQRPGEQRPQQANITGMRLLLVRGAIALLLALGIGALVSRRFTRPLHDLTQGAQAFHRGEFAHRIPVQGADEFTEVATVMNGMAGQVSAHLRQVEEDAARRRQLLADVAHELRNPVTTPRTMAGAMAEGLADDDARRPRAVAAMVRTSDRLLHLVTDLMELAKLDLHELPLHRTTIDLRALAQTGVEHHATAAAQAGITLHPVADGPPVLVSADPDRLAQVLDNLLDNAISYAGAGAELAVTLHPEARARLVVADTGRGIPAAHLPNIFEPFYRVDSARTPQERHSGLGLRIARGLVEAHGGTLTLESREGAGTTVTVSLS